MLSSAKATSSSASTPARAGSACASASSTPRMPARIWSNVADSRILPSSRPWMDSALIWGSQSERNAASADDMAA